MGNDEQAKERERERERERENKTRRIFFCEYNLFSNNSRVNVFCVSHLTANFVCGKRDEIRNYLNFLVRVKLFLY